MQHCASITQYRLFIQNCTVLVDHLYDELLFLIGSDHTADFVPYVSRLNTLSTSSLQFYLLCESYLIGKLLHLFLCHLFLVFKRVCLFFWCLLALVSEFAAKVLSIITIMIAFFILTAICFTSKELNLLGLLSLLLLLRQ